MGMQRDRICLGQWRRAWVQAFELLHGGGHAAVALGLFAVGLGLAQLRLPLLQLLRQHVPLRPATHPPAHVSGKLVVTD